MSKEMIGIKGMITYHIEFGRRGSDVRVSPNVPCFPFVRWPGSCPFILRLIVPGKRAKRRTFVGANTKIASRRVHVTTTPPPGFSRVRLSSSIRVAKAGRMHVYPSAGLNFLHTGWVLQQPQQTQMKWLLSGVEPEEEGNSMRLRHGSLFLGRTDPSAISHKQNGFWPPRGRWGSELWGDGHGSSSISVLLSGGLAPTKTASPREVKRYSHTQKALRLSCRIRRLPRPGPKMALRRWKNTVHSKAVSHAAKMGTAGNSRTRKLSLMPANQALSGFFLAVSIREKELKKLGWKTRTTIRLWWRFTS